MLEIKNLHKSFGENEILHGISLDVKDGQIYGFIGHNGAGKTTTIRCAVGLLEFEQGEIYIDGKNIKQDPIAVKSITSFLPDNPDLYENLTCMQYLNFIADVFEIDAKTRTERITALGQELEIYDRLGDQIKALSHGMKQKVAVISALLHEPKLLVLDEPFVGLDPKASFIVKKKLHEICARGGSVFFSSHVLEVVQNLCDEIAIIKGGTIVAQGSVESILASRGSLEEVFLELEGEK